MSKIVRLPAEKATVSSVLPRGVLVLPKSVWKTRRFVDDYPLSDLVLPPYQRKRQHSWVPLLKQSFDLGGGTEELVCAEITDRWYPHPILLDGFQRWSGLTDAGQTTECLRLYTMTYTESQVMFHILNNRKKMDTNHIVHFWPYESGELVCSALTSIFCSRPAECVPPAAIFRGAAAALEQHNAGKTRIQTMLGNVDKMLTGPDRTSTKIVASRLFRLLDDVYPERATIGTYDAVALGYEFAKRGNPNIKRLAPAVANPDAYMNAAERAMITAPQGKKFKVVEGYRSLFGRHWK